MDNNYQIIAFGDISVESVEDGMIRSISPHEYEQVELIWQNAQKQGSNELFNGSLPHFISVENESPAKLKVKVQFVEYKLFFAQQRSNIDFGIRPLGVSGIVVLKEKNQDSFLFAQRSGSVTEYPLYWELAPSGSLDRECVASDGGVDFLRKLLSEFEEETGLSKDIVQNITPFAITFDEKHKVYDVCCKIEIDSEAGCCFDKLNVSREFCSFQFVPSESVNNFIKAHERGIVVTSLALLKAYSSIKSLG